ncbi:uncharacterized protein LACBIDRAFT_315972 [Laccaria bicolor S238N-H82]|uniref:Predicted protein n=1 Tax=Laccaria bicolor (strain S238N-H82 / ATCC MYA-4686) TaxID=486041 RepID=B0D3L7_LACBS|nr:uncharacterized protein LACBIDRAFT_315972 [Laccaria bicolor S238N-H82]EDR10946.1 predicted protein [Laccaria bicolor S238N-H82]|eukprot:XP_001878247.1 predicted protein [Laccaria bicolor S238N-H82]
MPLLDSFDPFATHPFTNNSGVVPQPPQPSLYPIPMPSPRARPNHMSSCPVDSTPPSFPTNSTQNSPPLRSPIPQKRGPVSPILPSSPTRPIFTPFQREVSSPDLLLKKKSNSTSGSSPASPRKSLYLTN